jgi:hypothetical protein
MVSQRDKAARRRFNEPTEDNVCRIMRRMALGQWIPGGVSAQAMAESKGCSLQSVQTWEYEARRRLRSGILLDEDVKASIAIQLQTNARLGQLIFDRAKSDPLTFNAAVQALTVKNNAMRIMLGMFPEKNKTPNQDADELAGKSERELLEIIARSTVEMKDTK